MGIAYKNSLATQGVSSDIFFVSSTRITRWLGRHEVRIRRSVGSRTGPQVPVVILFRVPGCPRGGGVPGEP